ncbi:NAD-dependent deacetylase [Zhouia amylolytica]|uniref:NAD-dependent protein deacylase n=2 Tax=Zhouia amylolytica TaxID=376730 RepID=W2UPL0_9FLAO|nr:Sir2 family NAD-dependent protein deacetylase [Zhouia amylolytica]ETN95933.1 NAD-dependent protein deacetylase, SIR2 family [Zhouia amylolytica AD3]SFS52913.1 NAD-dependent deacetylase [Zhouia amylolytica]
MPKKLVILSGAGISAESGINTFRDENGLWEGHDIMEVASPRGWENNPKLVLDFYNKRRRQLLEVTPNNAHIAIARIENEFDVTIVTQNVDDLHERSGSRTVIHLHGELLKARSSFDEDLIYDWKEDINIGDFCEHNSQLRPHIVWFGEAVPMMQPAIEKVSEADILMVVGTSMQVYPAASLVHYKKVETPIYFIDPKPNISKSEIPNLEIIADKATIGVPHAISMLSRI